MKKTINADLLNKSLEEQGLTQKSLAEALNVSPQAITNWIKGKDFPRPPTLLKLSLKLKLSFDNLVKVEDPGKPIIAFRKKGNSKTTDEHRTKAEYVGQLLKSVVPFLAEQKALRTLITSPSVDYEKLQIAVAQTRARLGIGELAVLDYDHLIGEFKNCGAVLIPVLWGAKQRHENALHIRLPQEDITFVFLNLDTRAEDFKFWMAHELAHVYTPDLAGKMEGEDYADAFAGSLLFPKLCAEQAHLEILNLKHSSEILSVLRQHSDRHVISLNTVYHQVNLYAASIGQPPLAIEDKLIHVARNTIHGPLISEALFDPLPPDPQRYIADCENIFQSDFFQSLRRLILKNEVGSSFVQQVLDSSLQDSLALYRTLRH